MARGRMLDRRFTESKKLQALHRDYRLVYASILPFLDREGRIIAEPIYLKAICFRHTDFEPAEIGAAVHALAEAGLVELYADEDNAAIIQYTGFDRFNSPNAKEAKSDLPGPGGEGVEAVRDPLICAAQHHALAVHVQATGNASGERNVNGTSTTTINDNPPLTPPTETRPATEDEADGEVEVAPVDHETQAALTLANRRRARNYAPSILAQHHRAARDALDDLQGIYAWKPAQFAAIAEATLELAREHGTDRTAAAYRAVVLSGADVRNPIAYAMKVLRDTPAAAPPNTRPQYDLDAIFTIDRRVN